MANVDAFQEVDDGDTIFDGWLDGCYEAVKNTTTGHDHDGTDSKKLDWDTCWTDAVHTHASDAEGGTTLTGVAIGSTSTIDGISATNLLDKTATESITGAFTFGVDKLIGSDILLTPVSSGTATEGRVYYDSDDDIPFYRDDNQWRPIANIQGDAMTTDSTAHSQALTQDNWSALTGASYTFTPKNTNNIIVALKVVLTGVNTDGAVDCGVRLVATNNTTSETHELTQVYWNSPRTALKTWVLFAVPSDPASNTAYVNTLNDGQQQPMMGGASSTFQSYMAPEANSTSGIDEVTITVYYMDEMKVYTGNANSLWS